jgi:hypothetical protein
MYYLPLPHFLHVQRRWFDSCRHQNQSQRKLFGRVTILLFHILQIYLNKSQNLFCRYLHLRN